MVRWWGQPWPGLMEHSDLPQDNKKARAVGGRRARDARATPPDQATKPARTRHPRARTDGNRADAAPPAVGGAPGDAPRRGPGRPRGLGTYMRLIGREGRRPVYVMYKEGVARSAGTSDRKEAERRFAEYLAEGSGALPHRAPAAGSVKIRDVIAEHREVWREDPDSERCKLLRSHEDRLLPFWGDLTLADANPANSDAYVAQRRNLARRGRGQDVEVGASPTRRELGHLRLVLERYCDRHGLKARPNLRLPPRDEGRVVWLGRSDVARLLCAARGRLWDPEAGGWARAPDTGRLLLRPRRSVESTRPLARLILIGAFTGTRSTAMCALRWRKGTDHGHVDAARAVMHRKGGSQRVTRKRQPPVRLCRELLRLVLRWALSDARAAREHVVSLGDGRQVQSPGVIFREIRDAAGFGPEVTIHVLRHTCANWLIEGGAELDDVGKYLGMSVGELERTYVQWDTAFSVRAADALADWGRAGGVG